MRRLLELYFFYCTQVRSRQSDKYEYGAKSVKPSGLSMPSAARMTEAETSNKDASRSDAKVTHNKDANRSDARVTSNGDANRSDTKMSEIEVDQIQTLSSLYTALNQLPPPSTLEVSSEHKCVVSDGDPKAHIMLIGEAPGAEENKQGRPFVGQSGQLLTQMLGKVGLDRHKHVYITNVLPWRPAENRTPSKEEVRYYLPLLRKHIELIRPKLIMLMGKTAISAFFDDITNITSNRGKWREICCNNLQIPTLLTYHPAYPLRYPSARKMMFMDILLLAYRHKERKSRGPKKQ